LTQMTYGFSRDDMHTNFLEASLIDLYLKMDILKEDPFNHLDVEGVGALMQMAISKGKAARPDLKIGVCGEQASSFSSISFFLTHQVDYISCSPSQLPLARFNAALAILKKYPFMGGERTVSNSPASSLEII